MWTEAKRRKKHGLNLLMSVLFRWCPASLPSTSQLEPSTSPQSQLLDASCVHSHRLYGNLNVWSRQTRLRTSCRSVKSSVRGHGPCGSRAVNKKSRLFQNVSKQSKPSWGNWIEILVCSVPASTWTICLSRRKPTKRTWNHWNCLQTHRITLPVLSFVISEPKTHRHRSSLYPCQREVLTNKIKTGKTFQAKKNKTSTKMTLKKQNITFKIVQQIQQGKYQHNNQNPT